MASGLLAQLELKGKVVAGDALYAQRELSRSILNQSQGGMYIYRKSGIGLRVSREGFGSCLQDCAAATLDLVFPAGQPSTTAAD